MSGWEIGTWAAIGVLVIMPPIIFVWFLFDAVKWVRRHPRRRSTKDR